MMVYRIVKTKGKEIEHFDFHHGRYKDALNKYFDIILNGDFSIVKMYEALLNENDDCIAQYLIRSGYKQKGGEQMITLNFLEKAKRVFTEATLIGDKICNEWARDCTRCPMRVEKDKCYLDGFEKMATVVMVEINRRRDENKRKGKNDAIL